MKCCKLFNLPHGGMSQDLTNACQWAGVRVFLRPHDRNPPRVHSFPAIMTLSLISPI
jgi:hypothetical protein